MKLKLKPLVWQAEETYEGHFYAVTSFGTYRIGGPVVMGNTAYRFMKLNTGRNSQAVGEYKGVPGGSGEVERSLEYAKAQCEAHRRKLIEAELEEPDGWQVIQTDDGRYRFLHLEKKLLTTGEPFLQELEADKDFRVSEGETHMRYRWGEYID